VNKNNFILFFLLLLIVAIPVVEALSFGDVWNKIMVALGIRKREFIQPATTSCGCGSGFTTQCCSTCKNGECHYSYCNNDGTCCSGCGGVHYGGCGTSCGPRCGDGTCQSNENSQSCPSDCGCQCINGVFQGSGCDSWMIGKPCGGTTTTLKTTKTTTTIWSCQCINGVFQGSGCEPLIIGKPCSTTPTKVPTTTTTTVDICKRLLSGTPTSREIEECKSRGGRIYCGNGWCVCVC